MRTGEARDGDARVSLAQSVFSCTHYFQAPATRSFMRPYYFQVHASQAKSMFSGFIPYNSRYPLMFLIPIKFSVVWPIEK